MKAKLLIPATLAATLSLPALSTMAATQQSLLGETAPASAADQTITINPDTKYVNVNDGQVVNFDVGGKTFTWNFDGSQNVNSFDLNQVAPTGVLDHPVTVYVGSNSLYMGD
jgi:hypothetical protein